MSELLSAALAYAARGLGVFPLAVGSKVPIAGTRGSKDATDDEATIREWWTAHPRANIALATGTTWGIYVVDVDVSASPIMARLPQTAISRTRKGWHYVYSLPDGVALRNSAKATRKDDDAPWVGVDSELHAEGHDCDTRGEGGYIVAPPSIVDGHRYEWIGTTEIAPLPQWIVDRMSRSRVEVVSRASFSLRTAAGWGRTALDRECQDLARTGEGGRNHALNRAAFRVAQIVAGGHLSEGEATARLHEAAAACGLPEREIERTIRSGFAAGLSSPRGPQERPTLTDDGADYYVGTPEVLPAIGDAPTVQIDVDDANAAADAAQWARLARMRALGGLCDSFAAWLIRGADHPQPGLTIGATVTLGAALAARRLTFRGATSTLYSVALAQSGDGKSRPAMCLQTVLGKLWSTTLGPSTFSSTAAFVDTLKKATAAGVGTTLLLDEYGMQLASMLGPRASPHRQDLKQALTELATKGTGSWSPGLSLARGGGATDLTAPAVTLYGSTTPDSLHRVLGAADVADGFAGRHLWFEAQRTLPDWQPPEGRGDDAIPGEVAEAVAHIKGWHDEWHGNLPGNGSSSDGTPLLLYEAQIVTADDGALELLTAYKLRCDDRRRRRQAGDAPRATLARCPEYATRAALCLAVLASPELQIPHVSEPMAAVAIEIADASAETFASHLRQHARPEFGDSEGQIDYVLAAIEALHREGQAVTRASLLRAARRINARTLDEVIERLQDDGTVKVEKITGRNGRPATVLALCPTS